MCFRLYLVACHSLVTCLSPALCLSISIATYLRYITCLILTVRLTLLKLLCFLTCLRANHVALSILCRNYTCPPTSRITAPITCFHDFTTPIPRCAQIALLHTVCKPRSLSWCHYTSPIHLNPRGPIAALLRILVVKLIGKSKYFRFGPEICSHLRRP